MEMRKLKYIILEIDKKVQRAWKNPDFFFVCFFMC